MRQTITWTHLQCTFSVQIMSSNQTDYDGFCHAALRGFIFNRLRYYISLSLSPSPSLYSLSLSLVSLPYDGMIQICRFILYSFTIAPRSFRVTPCSKSTPRIPDLTSDLTSDCLFKVNFRLKGQNLPTLPYIVYFDACFSLQLLCIVLD